MGAKVCLILGILLLSNILFIPTEVMASRLMLQELQTAKEMKSDKDARSNSYKPLKPGDGGMPRKLPCPRPHCTEGVPEEQKSDIDATIPYNPLKPAPTKPGAGRGKPYTRRPCTPKKGCNRPPGHV